MLTKVCVRATSVMNIRTGRLSSPKASTNGCKHERLICDANHLSCVSISEMAANIFPVNETTYNDSNTTSFSTPSLPSAPTMNCTLFTFIVYAIIFSTMCIFGLVGNTLSFIVLQAERRSHVATFTLQVIV